MPLKRSQSHISEVDEDLGHPVSIITVPLVVLTLVSRGVSLILNSDVEVGLVVLMLLCDLVRRAKLVVEWILRLNFRPLRYARIHHSLLVCRTN